MHLTLTDRLTCPRCGPTAGLVLFMDEVAGRRVVAGSLGCPLCRARYPIAGRVADLRATADEADGRSGPDSGARSEAAPAELSTRVAALLGLDGTGGFVLVDGRLGLDAARGLRALVPEVEPVVAIDPERARQAGAAEVSALLDSGPLPLADRAMRAVAWVGELPAPERVAELARVCRPTGRLLLETGDAATPAAGLAAAAAQLEALGARIEARDARALLAVVR